MGFFLGIDGGGTKTECVLVDEAGEVLARATGAGANLRRVSPAELRATLGSCFAELRRVAGLAALTPEAVCAGFAGASDPEARAGARDLLAELLRPRFLYVVGDMEVALEAAVGAGRGAILIAGTGSIAYGRNDLGQQARTGGEGPRLSEAGELAGDAGSGFDIGRRAVQAVQQAEAGVGPATLLSEAVPAALGEDSAEPLAAWVSPERAADLAALVPVVARAAQRGDSVAQEILGAAAAELARLALTVLRELNLLATDVRVAASGGVFAESAEVFARVQEQIRSAAPRALVEPLRVSPAEGAVRLAQRLWLQEQKWAPAQP